MHIFLCPFSCYFSLFLLRFPFFARTATQEAAACDRDRPARSKERRNSRPRGRLCETRGGDRDECRRTGKQRRGEARTLTDRGGRRGSGDKRNSTFHSILTKKWFRQAPPEGHRKVSGESKWSMVPLKLPTRWHHKKDDKWAFTCVHTYLFVLNEWQDWYNCWFITYVVSTTFISSL